METGKCDPGVTNGRLFYKNSQCALCEATPIRWRRHMYYCAMCGLCDVCIQKLQMQSSTLNLLPVENVWLLQNAPKQLTAIEIFFSENSRFAIRALNDSDHTILNFVGSFFDATLLRTQKTKQIVFDGAYFRDVLLQKASKEKDVDEVQVQKNSIHSTTSSAIIVLTSLAARVLLSAAAIKLNLRNSYLHTGMVLEYCREKTVDGQKVRQVYAATVVDMALIGSGIILSLFEIVNQLELKLVEKEQIVDLMKSDSIHPIGWADFSNLPLVGADSDTFEWANFLSHTSFVPVPYVFFSETQIENCPEYLEHKLKYLNEEYEGFASLWCPGMKLEALDRDDPSLIGVVTVIKVEQNNVTITFDGWPESYNYTAKAWSEDFHPIGYCDFVKHPSGLYKPQDYASEFDWLQYLNETKSVPVPYESFSENQKRGTPKHSAYFNAIDYNPSDEQASKDTAETWKQILPIAIDWPLSITCNVASTTSTQHTLHGFDGFFIIPSGLSDIYQMSSMLYDRRIALSFTDTANYQCQHFANQEEPIVTLTNVSLSELSPGDYSEKKQKSTSVDKFLSQLLLYATPVSWKKICEVGFSGLVAKDANDLAANLTVLESINRGLRTLANTLLCLSFEDLANAQTTESTTTTDWQTIMQMVTKKCAEMGGTKANAIYSPQRELNVRFKHPGANDKEYTFEQLQLGFMPQLYATADENRTKSSHMGIDVDPKYNPEYLENLQFCEALNINNVRQLQVLILPAALALE
uniref:Uncharacterized protein n=1 Tax=Plectus sambesii TaxID=2011161 RepID=A0A914VT02_9BILA